MHYRRNPMLNYSSYNEKKKKLKYLKNNNNYKSSKSIKLIIRFFSVIKIVITCTIKIQSYILYEIYMYDFYVRVT